MKPKRDPRDLVIPIGILGLALVPRLLFLQADPSHDLSWSLAPFTDGPAAMTPARMGVQTARGAVFPQAPFDSNPTTTILLRGLMALLGTGLWQGRLLFALAGSASCLLLYLLVARIEGRWAGASAGLLLALNYISIQYSRLALEETLIVLLGLVALSFVRGEGSGEHCGQSDGPPDRPKTTGLWRPIATGMLLAAGAIMVKLHGWLFVPVAGLYAAQCFGSRVGNWWRKPFLRWMVAAASGFFLLWIAASVLHLTPVYAGLSQYFSLPSPGPGGAGPAASTLWRFPNDIVGRFLTLGLGTGLFARMPLVSLLGWLLLLGSLSRSPGRSEDAPRATPFHFWLLLGALSLGFLRYRPLRYETLIISPLCALAGTALVRMASGAFSGRGFSINARTCLIWFAGLLPVAHLLVVQALRHLAQAGWNPLELTHTDFFPQWPHWRPGLVLPAMVLAAAMAALSLQLQARDSVSWLRTELGKCRTVAGLVLVACCLLQVVPLISYFASLKFNTLAASRDAGLILDRDAVVTGRFADAVTIETALCSFTLSERVTSLAEVLSRFPDTTHLLVTADETHTSRCFDSPAVGHLVREGLLLPVRSYLMGPSIRVPGMMRCQVLLRLPDRRAQCPPTDFEEGVARLRAGDLEPAREAFGRFLQTHPGHVATLLKLAALEAARAEAGGGSGAPLRNAQDLVSRPGARYNEWDLAACRAAAAGSPSLLKNTVPRPRRSRPIK